MAHYENRQSPSGKEVDTQTLFAQLCTFVLGAASAEQFPISELPEFAFVGRSNVGKSSLINALLNRKNLVKTSKTPGRTQQINFFNLSDYLMLVDLPGYGYAKVSRQKIHAWTDLMHDYLRSRAQIKRVFVLVDARHGLKESDEDMLRILDESAVSVQIILTKCDKINREEQATVVAETQKLINNHPSAFPEIILTSAEKKFGLEDLRTSIFKSFM